MGVKITDKRLRPKPSQKNKSKITQSDKDYLEWVKNQDLACFSCGDYGSIELHHVRENSCSCRSHTLVIPLCGEKCHRLGTELSAHNTPKRFRLVYPIEVQIDFANDLHNMYLREIT